MPNLIFEIPEMVKGQLFQNPKSSTNMVEEKEGHGSYHIVECRHGLNPFSKIVNYHDNILVVISGWWSELHKINGPFA